jgi:hypothetical protein
VDGKCDNGYFSAILPSAAVDGCFLPLGGQRRNLVKGATTAYLSINQ